MPDPYADITFAIVVWNDAERLRALLEYVRPWFGSLAVAVQKSPDDTLDVAMDLADIIVVDEHHGFGDASFGPKLLPQIETTWTFKCDADEWPTETLLENLWALTAAAEQAGTKGVWIPFKSWTEDHEYEEQHSHLRLFHTSVGWPGKLHSRPPVEDGLTGLDRDTVGWIEHRRTLDEMMSDYINYYRIGRGDKGWDEHNTLMMRSACSGVASRKGWRYVRSFPWWPDVRDAAFEGKEPRMVVYCAGAPRTGTRMVFDIVTHLGQQAVHAVVPGYNDKPEGGLDLAHPVWRTPASFEEEYGVGEWIVIDRERQFAAKSAIAAGKAKDAKDYDRIWRKAHKTIGDVGGLVISYEDAVADPQRVVDVIAGFLGVPSVLVDGIFDANEKYREPVAEERVEEADAPDAAAGDEPEEKEA